MDVGLGVGKEFEGRIIGGEVGIMLDGRGRNIQFLKDKDERMQQVLKWSENSKEYPKDNY